MREVLITICLLLPLSALNRADITHNANSIFYVNPAIGEVKLKARRGALTQAFVVIESVRSEMKSAYEDANFQYFTAMTNPFDTSASYHFVLKHNNDSLNLPASAEFKSGVPIFNPPVWSQGLTYYTVFTDGFFNGDKTNDPDKIRPWDKPPKNWQSYGGDLKGIIIKFDYIDSLKPDVLMLQPIFTANSNHKFNPSDYATIDKALGDTIDLRELIELAHKKNIKVVLSVTFSHTGRDFPTFTDIGKNAQESRYLDWYLIDALPVKSSPPNYECWQGDYRFPKLNLANPQVINYLIGYLGYWKRFGLDGFYIGEDENMNSAFIKKLRAHLKARYPEILLLGSDKRLLTGETFDGSANFMLSELIDQYFIHKNIPTSEFDRKLRQMFFFTPTQCKNINFLSISNWHTRVVPDPSLLNNLYAFLFTCLGSPVIMYGEEIGMSRCELLNLGSFAWDMPHNNLFAEIKKLIALRRANPIIKGDKFFTLYVNDINKVYAFDRGGIIVVLNSGDKQSFVSLPAWDGNYTDMISGEKLTAFSQQLKLSIEPKSYRILKREI